jgi:hypothetical protein
MPFQKYSYNSFSVSKNDAYQFAKISSKSLSPFSPAFKHITEALANFPTAFVLEIDAVHSKQEEKKNKIKEVQLAERRKFKRKVCKK